MDPLAEKYYSLSPYAYCAGNPMNLVDPEGEDIWKVDSLGNVVSRTRNKKKDAFYLVSQNSKGEYQTKKDEDGNDISIEFEYGTIEHYWQYRYNNVKDDVIKVRGDDNGEKLFEFFSKNITTSTSIEYSLTRTGIEGEKGLNFVSTSHTPNHEYSFRRLYSGQLKNGYTIREHIHSHPNTPKPSPKDKEALNYYKKAFNEAGRPMMIMSIYYVGSHKKYQTSRYVYKQYYP